MNFDSLFETKELGIPVFILLVQSHFFPGEKKVEQKISVDWEMVAGNKDVQGINIWVKLENVSLINKFCTFV